MLEAWQRDQKDPGIFFKCPFKALYDRFLVKEDFYFCGWHPPRDLCGVMRAQKWDPITLELIIDSSFVDCVGFVDTLKLVVVGVIAKIAIALDMDLVDDSRLDNWARKS